MALKILMTYLILFCFFFIEATSEASSTEIGDIIKLPEPTLKGNISVEQAIQERRAIRVVAKIPLKKAHVSQLLWACGGKTIDGITGPTRAYPSAGGIYPLEIYLVSGNVMELEAGIYRYNWETHSIGLIKKGDFRVELAKAALGQNIIQEAPITIIVTAIYEKTGARYGQRGITRYVHMDVGHMGQNVHLMAQAMELGAVMLGAFRDEEVARVLGIGRDEMPIYIMPVGYPWK